MVSRSYAPSGLIATPAERELEQQVGGASLGEAAELGECVTVSVPTMMTKRVSALAVPLAGRLRRAWSAPLSNDHVNHLRGSFTRPADLVKDPNT